MLPTLLSSTRLAKTTGDGTAIAPASVTDHYSAAEAARNDIANEVSVSEIPLLARWSMKSREARRVRPTQPLQPSQQQLLSVEDKELATVRRSRPRRGLHCTNSILSNSIGETCRCDAKRSERSNCWSVTFSRTPVHLRTMWVMWTLFGLDCLGSHFVGAFSKFGSFLCLCGIQSILW